MSAVNESSYAAPVVALLLALVPVVYVGSYIAIAEPSKKTTKNSGFLEEDAYSGRKWAAVIYWPIEQIDRKVRQREWNTWPPISLEEVGS